MSTSTTIHPKVAAQTSVSAIVTLVATILAGFGVIVPDDVSAAAVALIGAAVTLIGFIAGYNKTA